MNTINKKDFSRIYELMSFERNKTLFEMEQKWDNILNEDAAPGGLQGSWDPATKTYTIAKNEYLTKIAKAFGVDWKKMYEDNKKNLKSGNPNTIYAGEKLVINDFGGTSTDKNNTTAPNTTTTTPDTPTTAEPIKLKYNPNALMYYALSLSLSANKPGGDFDNLTKYSNLALYFQNVRDKKGKNVSEFKITQTDVDDIIAKFEKEVASNNSLYDEYTQKGQNTTIEGSVDGNIKTKTRVTTGTEGTTTGTEGTTTGTAGTTTGTAGTTTGTAGTTTGGENTQQSSFPNRNISKDEVLPSSPTDYYNAIFPPKK